VALLDCTPGTLNPNQMLDFAKSSIEGITQSLLLTDGEHQNG